MMDVVNMSFVELAEKMCAFSDGCVGKSEKECRICYNRELDSEYCDKNIKA